MLRLYTLGAFEIRQQDGEALPKPATLKSQSLLAYLACHPTHPHPRDHLTGMFWGDRPERKARRSLSTALWHIRRCLPDDATILSDVTTVQFNPDAPFWLDARAFDGYAEHDDIVNLQAAAALYQGHFLDGFYDDWILTERYRLESVFANVLARLPEVEALLQRALTVDEAYDEGALHEFALVWAGSAPGARDRAAIERHYRRALELSAGQRASLYVAYAMAATVPAQDPRRFRDLMDRALAIDPDARPGERLLTIIAQSRARWLLTRVDELFLE